MPIPRLNLIGLTMFGGPALPGKCEGVTLTDRGLDPGVIMESIGAYPAGVIDVEEVNGGGRGGGYLVERMYLQGCQVFLEVLFGSCKGAQPRGKLPRTCLVLPIHAWYSPKHATRVCYLYGADLAQMPVVRHTRKRQKRGKHAETPTHCVLRTAY